MPQIHVIGFDADDTLWHTERLYVDAQQRFKELLSQYHAPEWIEQRLFATEMRNLQHFGYGIKAFALSMIETAIELTEGKITGRDLQIILEHVKSMIGADVELLQHAGETIQQLASTQTLMLITKGDLLDQESKIARSGLASFFKHIEIVSSKTAESYAALLKRHAVEPEHFLMVGNSLRSDIIPVLEIGGTAVYVPYVLTWAHEMSDPPPSDQRGFYQIATLGELPELVMQLNGESTAPANA